MNSLHWSSVQVDNDFCSEDADRRSKTVEKRQAFLLDMLPTVEGTEHLLMPLQKRLKWRHGENVITNIPVAKEDAWSRKAALNFLSHLAWRIFLRKIVLKFSNRFLSLLSIDGLMIILLIWENERLSLLSSLFREFFSFSARVVENGQIVGFCEKKTTFTRSIFTY